MMALEELLLFHLDKYLNRIVAVGDNLPAIMLDVITLAEREGWTGDLLRAIAAERPNLPDLQTTVARPACTGGGAGAAGGRRRLRLQGEALRAGDACR